MRYYQYKLKFGKNAVTSFGKRGCSHGRLRGGFNHYAYGIGNILSFHCLETWGDFNDMKL